jgi:uncharacterized protein
MNRPPLRHKIPRDQVPAGEVLCKYCTAKCCRYFALPMDTPESEQDFDFIRWYLLHDRASVFLEDGVWYLLVHTECRHLQPDNRCGIYLTRPQICRDYSTVGCEYEDTYVYGGYFECPEQVQEYIEARFHSRPVNESFRSPRPGNLPIIQTFAPPPARTT